MLHSSRLSIQHPHTGALLDFTAPVLVLIIMLSFFYSYVILMFTLIDMITQLLSLLIGFSPKY